MRKTALALTLILGLSVLAVAEMKLVETVEANPGVFAIMPRTYIHSPENKTYTTGSVPIDVSFEISQKAYDKSPNPTIDIQLDNAGFKMKGWFRIPAEFVSANDTWVIFHGASVLENLPDGPHTVRCSCSATTLGSIYDTVASFVVEARVPTVTILSPEEQAYDNSSIPLSFSIDEPISKATYSLDQQADVTVDGNTTLTGLADGAHSLTVYATDVAGKVGTSDRLPFTVGEAPSISVLSPLNQTLFSSNNPLTITTSEPFSWLQYSLDGQANVTVNGNMTLTWLSSGLHNLTVYACDEAGDIGASQTIHFTVSAVTWEWAAIVLVPIVIGSAVLVVVFRRRERNLTLSAQENV
jgi:hypothetical protein